MLYATTEFYIKIRLQMVPNKYKNLLLINRPCNKHIKQKSTEDAKP